MFSRLLKRSLGATASETKTQDDLKCWTPVIKRRADRFLRFLDKAELQGILHDLPRKQNLKGHARFTGALEAAKISPADLISSLGQIESARFVAYFEQEFAPAVLTSTRRDRSLQELTQWLSQYWSKVGLTLHHGPYIVRIICAIAFCRVHILALDCSAPSIKRSCSRMKKWYFW